MSEGIQAAILFLIVFAACMTCYKIGSMDGRDTQRRQHQRIRAIQHDLRQERANNR
jgi:hypothetical protein